MYELIIHNDATRDLRGLMATEPVAAKRIAVLLQELRSDQDQLDRLSQHGYGGTPKRPARNAGFNVGMWLGAQNQGFNLWRMRDFELSLQGLEYRVIYAYYPLTGQYVVLAVVHREFNYETDHPVTQRIFASYRVLEQNLW